MRSQIRWACVLSLYAVGSVVGQEASVRELSDEKTLAAFYRPDAVQSVHLQIADADLKRMVAALPERIDVPATFRWQDITVENVAVRFKGNSSSNPKQTHKRSFLIKFDKYDKDRRFFGLRQAALDNGIQFGSLFSEPIITEILRDHGIPSHRCNYARLFVNKEYRGVYVNVERIDEAFLESRFPGVKGALFKVDEGGPGCNLQYLGEDPDLYRKTFDPRNSAAKKEPARLIEWIKWINQSEPSEFAKGLSSKLEADDFLRTTGIMLFAGAFDQLTGWNPHNYFLFHDAKQDRWRYLPWDLDVGFCETAFGKIRVLDDWNAAWPVPRTGAPNPLLERILADPVLLERYRKEARKILDRSFEPKGLCKIVDAKYALIKDDLKDDPFPHRRATVPGDRSYDDIVESIKVFIHKRHATALKQLDDPGERPKAERPIGVSPQLVAKIHLIERRATEMQRAGKDVSPIVRLMRQLEPAIRAGRIEEAEAIIAEVSKLLDANK